MPKKKLMPKGSQAEQDLFTEVFSHYLMATEDNEARWGDWDTKYELFRNYIDEANWPYSAMIFIPETFTAIYEKSARLNGGRPRGRLIPRESGDIVGAKVNNELLNFQWDEAGREENSPMTAKWSLMDLQTRIYGASFAVVNWRYRTNKKGDIKFDGPIMRVLSPKDSLPNPAYSYIKDWFQYREHVTVKELETVNDKSLTKPAYKNLDLLRSSIKDTQSDTRDQADRGREISGLTDYLGQDESPDFKVFELITELRDDRKIVFSPKHGVIVKDEPNPYDHEQIPVTMLRYISIDNDIWGLSEIEPVEKLQKAMNALSSQAIDSINMDLYRIIQVRANGVQMHTLEFGPGKKWIMNNPGSDVVPLETSSTALNKFVDVYSVLQAMFRQAMGETSGQFSQFSNTEGDKTATEIQEGQLTRSVRDNFNKIFLAEAIKKQMMLWYLMNKQFVFSDPKKEVFVMRILGRDSIQTFKEMGLDKWELGASEEEIRAQGDVVAMGGEPSFNEYPKYPVTIKGEMKPKMELDKTGEYATIYMTPEDMTGNYDYMADVEPMQISSSYEERRLAKEVMNLLMTPAAGAMLQTEGKSIKLSELLLDTFDKFGYKGGEKYFEEARINEQTANVNPAGAGIGSSGGQITNPENTGGLENLGAMA